MDPRDLTVAASELAALLRLLTVAQQDLNSYENQADVGWLLPLAARLADDLARRVDEPQVTDSRQCAEGAACHAERQ